MRSPRRCSSGRCRAWPRASLRYSQTGYPTITRRARQEPPHRHRCRPIGRPRHQRGDQPAEHAVGRRLHRNHHEDAELKQIPGDPGQQDPAGGLGVGVHLDVEGRGDHDRGHDRQHTRRPTAARRSAVSPGKGNATPGVNPATTERVTSARYGGKRTGMKIEAGQVAVVTGGPVESATRWPTCWCGAGST